MADLPTHDDRGYPLPKRMIGRGWRPNAARPIDARRRAKFLEELAKHGIVGEAAKRASLHSHHGCIQTFYDERKKDPEFAKAWDEALLLARYSAERELHRRAVEGVDEPVFQGGKQVGKIKKYSDTLLLARMRKLDPGYRPMQRIDHGGTVQIKPIGLDTLTAKQRELLRELLGPETQDAEFAVLETPLLEDTSHSEVLETESGSHTNQDGGADGQEAEEQSD